MPGSADAYSPALLVTMNSRNPALALLLLVACAAVVAAAGLYHDNTLVLPALWFTLSNVALSALILVSILVSRLIYRLRNSNAVSLRSKTRKVRIWPWVLLALSSAVLGAFAVEIYNRISIRIVNDSSIVLTDLTLYSESLDPILIQALAPGASSILRVYHPNEGRIVLFYRAEGSSNCVIIVPYTPVPGGRYTEAVFAEDSRSFHISGKSLPSHPATPIHNFTGESTSCR